ncbi:helix-turn-helix domain-containing protein [Streptomyces sp. NBC_01298]|uniref:helix-turn-helix domain-containing protein n=1 Tax=Streptomyces sp. NBC_01298 TaxID=2903817 RepID=UPI002E128705|nr:helix-turn-helix domain-containing protein [Streptomyces sp. NBC_01298]
MLEFRHQHHPEATGTGAFRYDGRRYRRTAGISADGAWTLITARADPRLGAGVRGYRGYRLAMHRAQRRIEMPIGAVSMIFNFGDPLYISRMPSSECDEPAWTPHASLVAGLETRAALGEHSGRIRGIEVLLEPWLAFTVLDLAMHEIQGSILPLIDVVGPAGGLLEEQLAHALDWSDAFALVDAFLLDRRTRGREAAAQVVHAWQHLTRTTGTEPISRVSRSVGWSQRHLEGRFREQIGLPPRRVARMARLRWALRLLAAGHPPVHVAAVCDFYDQAHLNRDFKAMVGCAPGVLVAHHALQPRPLDRLTNQPTSALLPRAGG